MPLWAFWFVLLVAFACAALDPRRFSLVEGCAGDLGYNDSWTEPMADPNLEPNVRPIFAVCVADDGCDDLSAGMLYRLLPDEPSAGEGLLRVVDDSGEDYLYPANRFVVVEVPASEEQRVLAVASASVA